MWPIIVLTFGIIISFFLNKCAITPSYAHDNAILECSNNIVYKSVTKLNEFRMENGLVDEHFDSNNDNIVDIHVLSSIKGATDEEGLTPHDPNPVFWIVDLDFDGFEDKVYVDLHGEGQCGDIRLYRDLSIGEVNPEQQEPEDQRETNRGGL